jgi:hypothetical protein
MRNRKANVIPMPEPLGEPGSFEQEHVSDDDIARRAYQLFEERGNNPGYDQEDWFRAEQELRGQRRGRARNTRG